MKLSEEYLKALNKTSSKPHNLKSEFRQEDLEKQLENIVADFRKKSLNEALQKIRQNIDVKVIFRIKD